MTEIDLLRILRGLTTRVGDRTTRCTALYCAVSFCCNHVADEEGGCNWSDRGLEILGFTASAVCGIILCGWRLYAEGVL